MNAIFMDVPEYRFRVRKQLEQWVKGNSIHNDVDDECCPDFSCCHPDLLAPEDTRKLYLNAKQDIRETLLMSFLSQGLAKVIPDKTVFIINGKDEIRSIEN